MRTPTRLLLEMPGRILSHSRRACRSLDATDPRRLAIDVALLNLAEIAYRIRPFQHPVHLDGLTVAFTDYSDLLLAVEEIFLDGIYAVELNQTNPVIFDCGANVGLASLFLARRFPTAAITAFEPDPVAFRALTTNVDANFPGRVVCHEIALGRLEGTVDFWFAPDGPGSMVGGLNPRGHVSAKRSVQMRRLSSYIDGPIDLLKIDAEGGENDILADLIESGQIAQVDSILMEYHHHLTPNLDVGQHLVDLGSVGFDYQIASPHDRRVVAPGVFQDLLIYAYRPTPAHRGAAEALASRTA